MLYSYKMTNDSGFAPNPFHGFMTLATCKAQIRERKNIGDYVAGFTSTKLCNDRIGSERLIFIMRVTEKPTFDQYYNEKRFQCKKPIANTAITKAGDNIYKPVTGSPHGYIQEGKWNHCSVDQMTKDLKSKHVLISDEFYYFGMNAISVKGFNINIPPTVAGHGVSTEDFSQLLNYLKKYQRNSINGRPHKWGVIDPYEG